MNGFAYLHAVAQRSLQAGSIIVVAKKACSTASTEVVIEYLSTRRSRMTVVEEKQLLNSVTEISEELKIIAGLIKDLIRKQDTAHEKAHSQLVSIARKR